MLWIKKNEIMKSIVNCISKIFTFSFILFLASCSDNDVDSLFEEAPAIRTTNQITELETLLVSQQQGYSGIYFPNNSRVGGVNFHMNFTADQRVKMTSDFKSDTSLTDSRYEVSSGTTNTELVFTTGSRHINDLTQNSNPGTFFDTFFGNNVFQYVGEENGVITFREIRNRGIFVISPSGFTDFETESVQMANLTLANREAFGFSSPVDCATDSVFSSFRLTLGIETGGTTTNYNLNYNEASFYGNASTTNDLGEVSTEDFGFAFTETGIKISPPLEIDGVAFEDFIQNTSATSPEYVSTVDGNTATIFYDFVTEIPTDEDAIIDLPALGSNGYLYRPSIGGDPLTSDCFRQEVIGQMQANLDNLLGAGTATFFDFIFFFDLTSDACDNQILIRFTNNATGDLVTTSYCFDRATIINNRVYQNYTGPNGGTSAFLETAVMPLIDFFNSSTTDEGLLYTNEGNFNGFSNTSGAFTDMDNVAHRVQGLFFTS